MLAGSGSRAATRIDLLPDTGRRRNREAPRDFDGTSAHRCCCAGFVLARKLRGPDSFLLPCCYERCGSLEGAQAATEQLGPMLDAIRQLVHTLYDVQGLIQWGGTFLVCAIVFVETGLFVGFFLPGDSLLVTAGVFAAARVLNVDTLLPLVILCAICGDQVGYWIGRQAGHALYRREDSLFFKRRHLQRAHAFYEKYGGKTVILARFMPIVRTFCPPVAGAAEMTYARYLAYDIAGGCIWAGSMILGGYFLASLVPNISQRIHYVIAVVVVLSFLPAVIAYLRRGPHEASNAAIREPAAEHED